MSKSCRTLGGVASLIVGVAGWGTAVGQEAEGSWDVDTRLVLAGATGGGNSVEAPQADGFAGELRVVVARESFLENGVALEWRGEVRVRRDAPGRPSFAGGFGSCLAGPVCGAVSPATGVFVGPGVAEDGPEAFLEGASLTVSGAWGEGVVGLDSGVAARLDARAPTVLEGVSAFSPSLDPGGLIVTRARNDVTGPSAKLSYMTPRWVGFRAGVSFTPEANLAGADFDPDVSIAGGAAAQLENVTEAALSFSRRFRSSGVRVRAALTGVSGESGRLLGGFEDYSALGLGLEIEREGWSAGVRWLDSNNARPSGEGYEAVELGITRDAGPWRFGAEWGSASDDFLGLDGESSLIGVRRTVGEHFGVGLAYQETSSEFPVLSMSSGRLSTERSGLLVELSVRN